MAPKCCIPGSYNNYRSTINETGYVTMFKFPTDEDKNTLWLKFISRWVWKPWKYSVVCVKHFEEKDLSYTDVSKDRDDNLQEFCRNRCLLKPKAIPRILPGLPERFNKLSNSACVDPTERREKHIGD